MDLKILIIGASGTGCSTLGKRLAGTLGNHFFDGDDYYWLDTDPPYSVKRDIRDRQSMLRIDLESSKSWIFAGSPAAWAPFVLTMLTHVIFIRLPWDVRKKRVKAREKERFGKRVLKGGDMYESHKKFLEWSKGYEANEVRGRTLHKHLELIKKIDKPVFTINEDIPVDEIISSLNTFLEIP